MTLLRALALFPKPTTGSTTGSIESEADPCVGNRTVCILLRLSVSAVLFAGCASPPAAGNDVSESGSGAVSCERIVSLAPSITETLFALHLGDKVVGVTRYCAFPEAAKQKPSVGGYLDPDIEATAALTPTLAVRLVEHDAVSPKLDALGIPALTLDHSGPTAIYESIRRVGETCGVTAEASALICSLKERVAAVSASAAGRPRLRVLITMGRNMGSGGIGDVFAAGKGTFYDDLIRIAGGENAYTGEVAVPLIAKEGILQMNPEVIVDMVPRAEDRRGLAEAAVRADWDDLPVDAVRNGRVFVMDAPYAVVPGPRFVKTLETLARMLHGAEAVQ